MLRPKRILAAVDGSPAGFHALREAIRLAQWAKGGVTVITVAPSYEGDLSLVGVRNIKAVLQGQCEEILNEALEVAEEQQSRVRIVCEEGEIHQKIIERSETEDAHLIVLGNSGSRSFLQLFTGGVLTGISRFSSCDLLVVPHDQMLAWNKILSVIDHTVTAAVMERIFEIAGSFGGELALLFVEGGFFGSSRHEPSEASSSSQGGREVVERVQARAEHHGLKVECLVRKGSKLRNIVRVAREQNATLVMLASSLEKGLGRLAGPSLAERIVRRSRCPVLVVKTSRPSDLADDSALHSRHEHP